MEQVIVNLAVNARDAMQRGGELIVETTDVVVDDHTARTAVPMKPGSYVLFTISDTGEGMPPETLKRVFEPFFTTKQQGTGMGLATVYGIVKQSGGYIFVESELSVGTSFRIYFEPVSEPTEELKATGGSRPKITGTETVLVVEDEEKILDLVREVLSNIGYRVLVAHNGEEAWRLANDYTGEIHLLLADVVMPVLGGCELAERLRSQRPQMKTLFMSGYTGKRLKQADTGLSEGAAFLPKPFAVSQLIGRVRELLGPATEG
jgi:CheY-like chemotaxis protein